MVRTSNANPKSLISQYSTVATTSRFFFSKMVTRPAQDGLAPSPEPRPHRPQECNDRSGADLTVLTTFR